MAEFKTEIEIPEILEKQRRLIDVLGAKAKAFDYCLKAFTEKWDDFNNQAERLTENCESGEDITFDKFKEVVECTSKMKLMREVVCFMEETFKKCEEGGGEC